MDKKMNVFALCGIIYMELPLNRTVIFIYARALKGLGRGDYSFLGHICNDISRCEIIDL